MSDLRTACLGGFAYGALLYGAPLALCHVVYNRLGSARDATIVYLGFLALYGLWAAVLFLLGWAVAAVTARIRRAKTSPPAAGSGPRPALRLGLFGFNLLFWEAFFLYGLTYDQAPFAPQTARGMLAVLSLLALVIAAGVAATSWILFRLLERRASRRLLTPLAAGLAALGLALHLTAPWWVARAYPPPARVPPPPALRAEPTGLDVVLVGFDGADWRVARPLMDAGRLPTFSKLVQEGATAPLASIHDSNSAVIWASIYTGALPRVHGVLDFYRIHLPGMASAGIFPVHRTFFNELANQLEKVGLAERATDSRLSLGLPPVWEIADRAGLPIGVVDGYFYSFPALKPASPEGFFLSYGLDAFAPHGPGGVRYPELFAQPPTLFRQVRPFLDRGDFGWQSAALLDLLARRPSLPRFTNFYTHQPDSFQHWYWKWYEPERFFGVDRRDVERDGDRIPGIYRGFDAFLARLLARVGPKTVVIVVSDHGHSPTIVHEFYTQHRHGPPGILLMRGGPVLPGAPLKNPGVFDVEPTVLYLLGLPVPQDAAGRVLTEALDPEFVRSHPIRTVPSYRGLPPSPRLMIGGRDSGLNELEIQKLKALGYT